jgi:hypothetical protein
MGVKITICQILFFPTFRRILWMPKGTSEIHLHNVIVMQALIRKSLRQLKKANN